jgi:hypothetical protein
MNIENRTNTIVPRNHLHIIQAKLVFNKVLISLRGLHASLFALIGTGILFVAAWITGNLPKAMPEAATGAYDWHYSGSDWGALLQLFILLPFLGVFENIFVFILLIVSGDKAVPWEKLFLKHILYSILCFLLGFIMFLLFFKYCD